MSVAMRIFDAFPFDGELDLLEHRLRETLDLVDVVVLVEAAQTYRGAEKALTFEAHRERFDFARGKIRHVKLASLGPQSATPRERAAVQRNAALMVLHDAADDDVVLLTDVDEVPSAALLERLRAEGLAEPRRIAMTRHYGFADRLGPSSPCCPPEDAPFGAAGGRARTEAWEGLSGRWFGHSAVAAPMKALRSTTPFALRYGLALGTPLPDGGRHYSSVDPAAHLQRKLSRVFHAEYDGARETAPDHLARCRLAGVHHRGWWFAETPRGAPPADVARVIARFPHMAAPPAPSQLRRRLIRAWAWLRLWRVLPEGAVAFVDRRFELLTALLALPLLTAEVLRGLTARIMRLGGWRLRTRASAHHH